MAVLSDVRILEQLYEENISVDPFIYDNIQPASLDLTLGETIKTLGKKAAIRAYGNNNDMYVEKKFDTYQMEPGELILASVREKITISSQFAARIENRSSLARLGIDVSTGNFINPGYSGNMTIVIKNNNTVPVEICKGMRICQLVIEDVGPTPSFAYGTKSDAKYQGEKGVATSLLFKDKEYQEYLASNSTEERSGIGDFLIKRLQNKERSVRDILTKEQRERLGLDGKG